jgi:hypothetical protein
MNPWGEMAVEMLVGAHSYQISLQFNRSIESNRSIDRI